MAELRKIGVLSVMKLTFVAYALLGLLIGIGMAVVSLFMYSAIPEGTGIGKSSLIFGPLAIIILPIFYGLLGALFSGLGALIYNFLAARLGGIQVMILFPKN